MKIREIVVEAPAQNLPANTATKQPPSANKSPANPIGKAAFAAGQATAKGVQGAKDAAKVVGQAAATGAEKTANVVAKGAQATHDVATKVAGAVDKEVAGVQKIKQGIAGIGNFGTQGFMAKGQSSAASTKGSGDLDDAFSDIGNDDLKQMLMAIASGKELTPGQKTQLSNVAYKL